MPKNLHLSIEEPCHENWDRMTDSEKGKFCNSCQKQVIDFTGMTDAQLTAFFKNPVAGSACGRFYHDQLDRQIPVPHKRIPWVRYFFQITLPLFLTTLKLNAQKKKESIKIVQTDKPSVSDRSGLIVLGGYSTSKIRLDQKIRIRGKVLNEEGRPIPFASIDKGHGGTVADSSGAFSMDLLPDTTSTKLVVSCVGYEPEELTIQENLVLNEEEIIVRLRGKVLNPVTVTSGWKTTQCNMVLGGLSVTYGRKPLLRRGKPVHFSSFKIFSNPVRANSSIFIKPEKTEPGSYTIQLLNLSGQSIKQEEIKIVKGMGAFSFSIPAIPSGAYIVNLLNKNTGNKFSEELIVQ